MKKVIQNSAKMWLMYVAGILEGVNSRSSYSRNVEEKSENAAHEHFFVMRNQKLFY